MTTLLDTPPADAPARTERVLHVGCGAFAHDKLPPLFREPHWREIRLDIDPAVAPDLVASITDMAVVAAGSMDAVYSSHNIEHLYPHEVPVALAEMRRVLAPSGLALIRVPDLQEVARHVAEGRLEDALYVSPMGPIAPLDILFGHRPSLALGNHFMAHRTGFTAGTLAAALIAAGFAAVLMQRDETAFALTAVAFRTPPDTETNRERPGKDADGAGAGGGDVYGGLTGPRAARPRTTGRGLGRGGPEDWRGPNKSRIFGTGPRPWGLRRLRHARRGGGPRPVFPCRGTQPRGRGRGMMRSRGPEESARNDTGTVRR